MEDNETQTSKKLVILNQDILLSLFKNDKSEMNLNIKKFMHPKTSEPRLFVIMPNFQFYELIKYEPEFSSVFINDFVQSNINMFFATKFNVNYFLISILYSKEGEEVSLYNLVLNDEIKNKSVNLKEFIDIGKLEILFDIKKNDDDDVKIKFNLNKCLNWLKNKVLKLELYLKSIEKKNDLKEIKMSKSSNKNEELISSLEIVAQYINTNLQQLLIKELDLNELIENIEPNECKRVKSSVN
jgi:hypothetical protein